MGFIFLKLGISLCINPTSCRIGLPLSITLDKGKYFFASGNEMKILLANLPINLFAAPGRIVCS